MFEKLKKWFNELNSTHKIIFVVIISIIIIAIIIGVIMLICKLSKKQENFSFSNQYKEENKGIKNIAEAYTTAWIKSLRSTD